MMTATAAHTTEIKRINPSYVRVECTCGWAGHLIPIRTIEGWELARRDAKDHEVAPPRVRHIAQVERGVGSTTYGYRCSCGAFSGYGMRERHAYAAMLKHIGHVPTITPVREAGYGGAGGWAYELNCSCQPGVPMGDPANHRFGLALRHEDHLREVNDL